MNTKNPTSEKERYAILDIMRGLALMGIVLANFPEFGLWTFLSSDEQATMPTASVDSTVRFLQYMLVDGKFYTIFSILFGIGFSLILSNHGNRLFLRRMAILLLIGFIHLMFIWSGDILLLYAIGGLLLALFVKISDRNLLAIAILLIMLPIALDALTEFISVDFARPFYDQWWAVAAANGITEENFASWLRDADSYNHVFAFLQQGAVERMWEFVESHRLPKVLGLFIMGYLIGKHRLYTRLHELPLRRIFVLSLSLGLPSSILYAWSATEGHPYGQTVHSLLYAVSVIPMATSYISAVCLIYLRHTNASLWQWIAAPGRMALSCYISQSLVGIFLFYGIGLGLGLSFGLVHIELTALFIFMCQIVICKIWLHYFRFGPLEWLWRLATYGHYFPIKKVARIIKHP